MTGKTAIRECAAMRPEAFDTFIEMVRDCGTGIVQMPASCEMYLSQYLSSFDAERKMLLTALRKDVPLSIVQYNQRDGYDDHLDYLTKKLVKESECDADDARWAVTAWAEALDRPAGYEIEQAVDPRRLRDEQERNPVSGFKDKAVKTAMVTIVGAGGFLGGFVAVALVPIMLWSIGADVFVNGGDGASLFDKKNSDVQYFLAFLLLAVVAGITGSLGAIGAWLFAGGNENPWATFNVACGTAFVMVFLVTFMPLIPFLFKPIVYLCSVFGTTYKSAARGGNY